MTLFSDPTFYAGSIHLAHLRLRNPTVLGWDYAYELHIGDSVYPGAVSIEAGKQVLQDIQVTMPIAVGEYLVYARIQCTTPGHETEFDPVSFDPISIIGPEVAASLTWD